MSQARNQVVSESLYKFTGAHDYGYDLRIAAPLKIIFGRQIEVLGRSVGFAQIIGVHGLLGPLSCPPWTYPLCPVNLWSYIYSLIGFTFLLIIFISHQSYKPWIPVNSLFCADVPLRNYWLTQLNHPASTQAAYSVTSLRQDELSLQLTQLTVVCYLLLVCKTADVYSKL